MYELNYVKKILEKCTFEFTVMQTEKLLNDRLNNLEISQSNYCSYSTHEIMRKFQALLLMLKQSFICCYIICMNAPLQRHLLSKTWHKHLLPKLK